MNLKNKILPYVQYMTGRYLTWERITLKHPHHFGLLSLPHVYGNGIHTFGLSQVQHNSAACITLWVSRFAFTILPSHTTYLNLLALRICLHL